MANSPDLNLIQKQLMQVKHPELKKDIITLGMVSQVEPTPDGLSLVIKTPSGDRRIQLGIEAQVRQLLGKIDGVGKPKIKFEVDPSLAMNDGNRIPHVKKVIAVGSGKGGVGKSTVTVNLASQAAREGFKVGILDADIYGPSVGKMFGTSGKVALKSQEDKIYPLEKDGLKIISFSFLVHDDQPIVWRGPMLGKAIEQFLYDIVWGELDYLFIDLPPGTGDVQLSLAQLIDLDGVILVTTPQSVAILDANRAAAMFRQVKVPVIGVVENMSGFVCPKCGTTSQVFGSGGGSKLADSLRVPFLGNIPLLLEIMESGEKGKPAVFSNEKAVSNAYSQVLKSSLEELKNIED